MEVAGHKRVLLAGHHTRPLGYRPGSLENNVLLVLTRKPNQAIVIGDHIRIVVVSVDRDQVRIGIEAPRDVTVHRAEVYAEINRETTVAPKSTESDITQAS